ncbi:MAG: alpha/beta hydrolase-fold protein [Chloroflexota bacterium]|nr:esterase family protein [Dehalococcoidia bacterium]MDW8252573.1 alpha/beta hydrolase-fold protein [Chloroflexota bacterium]
MAVALFLVGVLFGEPVPPDAAGPQRGVSPVARRTLQEVLEARYSSGAQRPADRHGELREERFFSPILGREMTYAVYLPPGYAASDRRYPVLYALHGVGGNHTEWISFGVADAADAVFAAGEVEPFIMVFPQGDQSYWFNHPGGDRWADYVTEDLIPTIDARYRTIAHREARAIGGLSMGATGALQFGLRRPDLFGIVGAHSPSFRTTFASEDFAHFEYLEVFWYFRNPAGYRPYDPFELAPQQAAAARSLRIWLDVGDADIWRPTVERFHALLTQLDIPHEFSIGSGIHEFTYWGPRMVDYVTFYGRAFSEREAFGS